jgi:hypothetical protein
MQVIVNVIGWSSGLPRLCNAPGRQLFPVTPPILQPSSYRFSSNGFFESIYILSNYD